MMDSLRALFCAAIAFSTLPHPASAQGYPSKPVTIVVPFAAGGSADVLARLLGQEIAQKLGQPVIVDNKAGAGGSIGAAAVAKAPADGHTLLLVTAGHAGMGALYPSLTFDPVKDFRPVVGLATAPIGIAVNANSKYQTLQDLIAAAKANPGKLNCAGGGGGATVTNLAFELLKSELGLKIEAINYRGSGPAMTALLAGEIDCNSDTLTTIMPHAQSGKTRVLATTSATPTTLLANVPTVAAAVLPNFNASVWYGVLAPAGTPDSVVEKLHDLLVSALAQAEIREKLKSLGAEPTGTSGKDFGAFIAGETARWSGVIKKLGLTAN